MYFINILFATLVASKAILPSVSITENPKLVESVDIAIKKYLEDKNSTKSDALAAKPKSGYDYPVAKITSEYEARGFVKYAGASYCEQRSVLNWVCDNCNGYTDGTSEAVYFSDEETNTAGYLAVNQDKHLIVLSYRGTQDIVNWLHNFDTALVDANLEGQYSDAGFHSGFNTMTNALLKDSAEALQNSLRKYPDFKVVFTGHSLGGAIAALTAFKLAQAGVIDWEKTSLITYGQPRLGNPEFASYLNSQPWTSTRVTSYGDLVAISPGRTLGYAHNQYNMHINSDGYTIQCSPYEEDDNCIADHLIPFREAHFTYWDQRMNTKC